MFLTLTLSQQNILFCKSSSYRVLPFAYTSAVIFYDIVRINILVCQIFDIKFWFYIIILSSYAIHKLDLLIYVLCLKFLMKWKGLSPISEPHSSLLETTLQIQIPPINQYHSCILWSLLIHISLTPHLCVVNHYRTTIIYKTIWWPRYFVRFS